MSNHIQEAQASSIQKDCLDDLERGTPQRERIFRSSWLNSARKEGNQRIDPIRQCNASGYAALHRSNILLLKRRNDPGLFAAPFRIIATHDALEFGELAYHASGQIGLREQTGAPRGLRVALGEIGLGEPAGEITDPVGLGAQRAHTLIEQHGFESGEIGFERDLQILFPEKFRIRQPRSQNLAIPRNDRCAAIPCGDVRGADEGRSELAVLVVQHEIFLVGTQSQLDHLARHLEESRIEMAEQWHRPFGEPRILGDQPFVGDDGQSCFGSQLGRAVADHVTALGSIYDDMTGAQLRRIIVGIADGDDTGMVEAVADSRGATCDAVDLERYDIVAEQGDNPLERTDPPQRRRRK